MLMVNQLTGFGARRAAAGTGGPEATAFLARTSGLDATHTNAYIALIDGLVADGVWSRLDVLHIYATQDSTTALLNLVSSSFNGTIHGSPTFTADLGFTGAGGAYIDTGFNPTTAPSPKYIQDSAHLSAWGTAASGSDGNPSLGLSTGGSSVSYLLPRDGGGFLTAYINTGSGTSATVAVPTGHSLGSRNSSTQVTVSRNGSNVATNNSTNSTAPVNLNLYTLGYNAAGSANSSASPLAMISCGSSLDATDTTNFYNRLRTYMTAVGVP